MGKYFITEILNKDDIIENDRISDKKLDYLIERSNTLSEIESILGGSARARYCLEAAVDDVDKLNIKSNIQNTITLMTLMNVMNEFIYYQTECEYLSENVDDIIDEEDEEEEE